MEFAVTRSESGLAGLLGKRCSSQDSCLAFLPQTMLNDVLQIIGPHDEGIAAAILENLQPNVWEASSVRSSSLCVNVTATMREAYFQSLAALSVSL